METGRSASPGAVDVFDLSARFGRRQRHGVRPVHQPMFISDLMRRLGTGQRLEALWALIDGPRSVSDIGDSLFLNLKETSRDLEHLQRTGLVTWSARKTSHIYQLTDMVQCLRRGQEAQLVIRIASGNWILLNSDESIARADPPRCFVDSTLQAVAACG